MSEQDGLAVAIEGRVAPDSDAAAGATPVDVRLVQVTGDVGSQRLMKGGGAHQGDGDEVAEDAPVFGCQGLQQWQWLSLWQIRSRWVASLR